MRGTDAGVQICALRGRLHHPATGADASRPSGPRAPLSPQGSRDSRAPLSRQGIPRGSRSIRSRGNCGPLGSPAGAAGKGSRSAGGSCHRIVLMGRGWRWGPGLPLRCRLSHRRRRSGGSHAHDSPRRDTPPWISGRICTNPEEAGGGGDGLLNNFSPPRHPLDRSSNKHCK